MSWLTPCLLYTSFSDLDVIGFSQFYDGEVFAFNLDDGNIGFRIRTDDFSFKFTFISEVHGDFIGAVDDVIVCENDAVRIDDAAGTLAAACLLYTSHRPLLKRKKKFVWWFLFLRAAEETTWLGPKLNICPRI